MMKRFLRRLPLLLLLLGGLFLLIRWIAQEAAIRPLHGTLALAGVGQNQEIDCTWPATL